MDWKTGTSQSALSPGQIALELARIKESLPSLERANQMSQGERNNLSSGLSRKIREYGARLVELSKSDPDAFYYLAMAVFVTDMERISRMGTFDERRMMVVVYPEKVKEYLKNYLDAAPSGTFAAKARGTLATFS